MRVSIAATNFIYITPPPWPSPGGRWDGIFMRWLLVQCGDIGGPSFQFGVLGRYQLCQLLQALFDPGVVQAGLDAMDIGFVQRDGLLFKWIGLFFQQEVVLLQCLAAKVFRPAVGHVGMVVSAVAERRVWQPLADWLADPAP